MPFRLRRRVDRRPALTRAPEPIFPTNWLSAAYSPAADFQHATGGMLAVILSVDDPWILLWFNAEQIESVNWAGNPHRDRSDDLMLTLSQRSLFEARAETLSGARARTLPELDAAMRLRITGRSAESPRVHRTQLAPHPDLHHRFPFMVQRKGSPWWH